MAYLESDPEVQRVRYEVRRFRQHLITYIAVVGVLFLVNVLSGGFWYGHWWFLWVALIWGVFLALQAAHLFGDHFGHAWEDRMVDQVLANRRRRTAEASRGAAGADCHATAECERGCPAGADYHAAPRLGAGRRSL
jgi:hypothetical protein